MEQKNEQQELMRKVQVFSEVLGRFQFFSNLGLDSYDGSRDIYKALGYPKEITWQNYWARYGRQDIAKAIIDRPVKASWHFQNQSALPLHFLSQ